MKPEFDYQALYLHIPFCARRCNYCDFETSAASFDDPLLDVYTENLIDDILSASCEGLLFEIKTIYIGGGTPTFLGLKRLEDLIGTISSNINLRPETEFTVEANPESLTAEILHGLANLGVNRISIGIQSFNDSELHCLGRIHDAKKAELALELAAEHIQNVSIDLMCGIPQQDASSWQNTLDRAVQSGVKHISVYPLTLEQGTPFSLWESEGKISLPDEDRQAELMELAALILPQKGFRRYEVASYAQPGFECRHNIAYWTGLPYIGLGRGAAGMRERADIRERLLNGEVIEVLSLQEAMLEDLMLGMRMSCGVSFESVIKAAECIPKIADTFEELLALGLVEFQEGLYKPTPRGWLMGNELFGRIWGSL